MKSRTYILNPAIEKTAVEEAVKKYFQKVEYDEIVQENSADREWIKYRSQYILDKYTGLSNQELAWLVECQIISFLEDNLWGHRFEAVAKVTCKDDELTDYSIYAHINVLREGYTY